MSPPHPALREELIRRLRLRLAGDAGAGQPAEAATGPRVKRFAKRSVDRFVAPALGVALRYTHADMERLSAELREHGRLLRAIEAEVELLKGTVEALSSSELPTSRHPPG